jgi:Tfp pilus assembly protein PilO
MNQSPSNIYKYISIVLFLLLLFAVGYIFKLSNQVNQVESSLASEIVDKSDALSKLEEMKAIYDEALQDESELSADLEVERKKVSQLIAEIKSKNIDASILAKYQKEIKALDNKMRSLILENDALKRANAELATQIDSVSSELSASSLKNEELLGQNEELNKKLNKAARLVITNLNAQALKIKSSGKEIETDRASRVNAIKIEFTIPENDLANSGEKLYFIQVIDPKNNIIGDKKELNFEDKLLVYSFPSKVNYSNKTIKVAEIIKGEDFAKGRYIVNIFDNDTQVSSNTFDLK